MYLDLEYPLLPSMVLALARFLLKLLVLDLHLVLSLESSLLLLISFPWDFPLPFLGEGERECMGSSIGSLSDGGEYCEEDVDILSSSLSFHLVTVGSRWSL